MAKKTTNEWIDQVKLIHGDRYNYDKSKYTGSKDKLTIICKEHGEFLQAAEKHAKGQGCPRCSQKGPKSVLNLEQWINKVSIIHDNKYDYSKCVYTRSKDKVIIICPIHGEFEQAAGEHFHYGCIKCANVYKSNTSEFIKKSNKIHNNLYNYSLVNYNNAHTKVCIVCPKHGDFWQEPNNHLNGQGCPICKASKGELLIYEWLRENDIKFKREFELITPEIARDSNLMLIDFFVIYNNKQYFIEYDGIQHYEYVPYFHKEGVVDFEKQLRRDKVLNNFCELHKDKVTLIRFNYQQSNEEIIEILNKMILNK